MAGDWIKMRTDLAEDPAVISIAAAVGLDEFAVVGRLQHLWAWADQQTRDGHAVGVTPAWIDRKVQRDGFATAMQKAGWLKVTSQGLTLPNFDRHNGETGKARALGSKRKQRQRAKEMEGQAASLKPSRKQRDKSVTREDKREDSSSLRSEEGKSPRKRGPSASSVEIPDWMPGKEWDDFVEMRRAKGSRAPFTVAAAKGIIAELTKLREVGHDPAKVLQASVNNGWSGVFALKGANGKDAPSSNWWDGKPGILDKGIELGIPAPADEHPNTWAHFKASVWVAAGDGPWWDDTSVAYPIAVKLRDGGVDLGGLAVQAVRKEDAHA